MYEYSKFEKIMILFIVILLGGCVQIYDVSSSRNENITLDELRVLRYTVGNTCKVHFSVEETGKKNCEPFNNKEKKLIEAFNEGLQQNFYNESEENISNAVIDLVLNSSDRIYDGVCPLIGQTGVSSSHTIGNATVRPGLVGGYNINGTSTTYYNPTYGVTGYYPCKRALTTISVTAIAYKNKEKLFETTLNYSSKQLLSAKQRFQTSLYLFRQITYELGSDEEQDSSDSFF